MRRCQSFSVHHKLVPRSMYSDIEVLVTMFLHTLRLRRLASASASSRIRLSASRWVIRRYRPKAQEAKECRNKSTPTRITEYRDKRFGICSCRSMLSEALNPHRSCLGRNMYLKLEQDETPSLLVSGKTLIHRVIAHPSYPYPTSPKLHRSNAALIRNMLEFKLLEPMTPNQ